MPSTPARIYEQLGLTDESLMTWESVQKFGGLKPGTKVVKGAALVPRNPSPRGGKAAARGGQTGSAHGRGRDLDIPALDGQVALGIDAAGRVRVHHAFVLHHDPQPGAQLEALGSSRHDRPFSVSSQ